MLKVNIANASDCPTNKVMEKAMIMDKGPGSLGCSKPFCTLPFCSKSRMMLFQCWQKKFSFTIHFYEIVLTRKIVTWKFATRKFTDLQYFNSSNQTSSIVTQHMAMFINGCCSKRHGLLWVKAHHYLKLNNMVILSNRNSLSFHCRNIFVQINLHKYNFTLKFFSRWLAPCYTQALPQLLLPVLSLYTW